MHAEFRKNFATLAEQLRRKHEAGIIEVRLEKVAQIKEEVAVKKEAEKKEADRIKAVRKKYHQRKFEEELAKSMNDPKMKHFQRKCPAHKRDMKLYFRVNKLAEKLLPPGFVNQSLSLNVSTDEMQLHSPKKQSKISNQHQRNYTDVIEITGTKKKEGSTTAGSKTHRPNGQSLNTVLPPLKHFTTTSHPVAIQDFQEIPSSLTARAKIDYKDKNRDDTARKSVCELLDMKEPFVAAVQQPMISVKRPMHKISRSRVDIHGGNLHSTNKIMLIGNNNNIKTAVFE